jgi:hypothetical protein
MSNKKPLPGVMASNISPTKAEKSLEINGGKNSTARHNKIPAKTALGPGNETENYSTSVPGPTATNRAINSRAQGKKTCSQKTRSAITTTISSSQGISFTDKPSEGGRNAGQSVFHPDFPLKFYVIALGVFRLSLPTIGLQL